MADLLNAERLTKRLSDALPSGLPRKTVARVLVIEDDLGFQDLLRAVLGRTGYRLFFTGSGRDGLQKFLSVSPDLVLLDMQLPNKAEQFVSRTHVLDIGGFES